MAAQTSIGSAKNLHLARAARSAGEAFAFNEPEAASASNRSLAAGLAALTLALAVALAFLSLM